MKSRFVKTCMLIHPPPCVKVNVEGTDGSSGSGVARTAAVLGRNKIHMPKKKAKNTDVSC